MAAAEEVVLLDAGVEEQAVGGAEPGARGERAGLAFLDVDLEVQLLLAPPALGREVHLLEEAEAVQRVAALLELGAREALLLLDLELAAEDLVARLGVAGDQDLVDRDLRALVDLVVDVDDLLVLVDLGLGLDVDEGVADVAVAVGDLQDVLAELARAEGIAGRELEVFARARGRRARRP